MVQACTVLYPGPARRQRHGYRICDAIYPRLPSKRSPFTGCCSLFCCNQMFPRAVSQTGGEEHQPVGHDVLEFVPPWTRANTTMTGLLQSSEEFYIRLVTAKHHPCFSAEYSATIATLMPVDKTPTSALLLRRNSSLRKWKHGMSPPDRPR